MRDLQQLGLPMCLFSRAVLAEIKFITYIGDFGKHTLPCENFPKGAYRNGQNILDKMTKLSNENLVCPQTFSHTVMCNVCLTTSNTLFDGDTFVRLNH